MIPASHQQICQTARGINNTIRIVQEDRISEDASFEVRMKTLLLCEELNEQKEAFKNTRLDITWLGKIIANSILNDIGDDVISGFALLRPKEVSIKGFPRNMQKTSR